MFGDHLPAETAQASAAALPAAAWLLHNLLKALSQHSTNPQLAAAAFYALHRAVQYAERTMLQPAMELLWKQQQSQSQSQQSQSQSQQSLAQLLRLCQPPVLGRDLVYERMSSRAVALPVGLPDHSTHQHLWQRFVNAAPQAVQEELATALVQDLCCGSSNSGRVADEDRIACGSSSDPTSTSASTANQQCQQASSSMYYLAHVVPACAVAQHISQLLQILQSGSEYNALIVRALLDKVWCSPELAQQSHVSLVLKQQMQAALQGSAPAWHVVSHVCRTVPGKNQLLLAAPYYLDLATAAQPARQDQQDHEQQQQRPSMLLAYSIICQLAQHGKHDALQMACSRLPLAAQQLLLGASCFRAGQETAVSLAIKKEASELKASTTTAQAGALLQCLLQEHVSGSEAHDAALSSVLDHFGKTAPALVLDGLLHQPSIKCMGAQHNVLLVDACILLKDNAAAFVKLLAGEASESQMQRLVLVLLQCAADNISASSSSDVYSSPFCSNVLWILQNVCLQLAAESSCQQQMMQCILSEQQVQQLLLQILQYNISRATTCTVAYLLGEGLHTHSAEPSAVSLLHQLVDLVVEDNCTAAATVFGTSVFKKPVIRQQMLQRIDTFLEALRQGNAGTAAWQLLAEWSKTADGAQAIAQHDWLFMLDVMMQQQSQVAGSSSSSSSSGDIWRAGPGETAQKAAMQLEPQQSPIASHVTWEAFHAAATIVANLAGTDAGRQLLVQEQHVKKLPTAACTQQYKASSTTTGNNSSSYIGDDVTAGTVADSAADMEQAGCLSITHAEAMKAVRSVIQLEAGKAAVRHNVELLLAVLQHQHSQIVACLAAEVLLQLVASTEGLHVLCSDSRYVAGIMSLLNREKQPLNSYEVEYSQGEAGDVGMLAADIVAALALTGPGRMRLSGQASFDELVRATQCPQLGVAKQAPEAFEQVLQAVYDKKDDTHSMATQHFEMQQHTQEQQQQGEDQPADTTPAQQLDLQVWHVQLLGQAAQRPHLSILALRCLDLIASSSVMEHKFLLPVAFKALPGVVKLIQRMVDVQWGDTFVPDADFEINLDRVAHLQLSARLSWLRVKHIARIVRNVVHPELVLKSKVVWRELQEAIVTFASMFPVRCADRTAAKLLARGGQVAGDMLVRDVAHQQALNALDSLIQHTAAYQSLQLLLEYADGACGYISAKLGPVLP